MEKDICLRVLCRMMNEKHTKLMLGIDGRSIANVIQLRAMKNRTE